MSKYSGEPFVVRKSATEIADRFADLTTLQSAIDRLPEADRQKVGDIKLEKDSISISTQQLGNVKFKVEERTPSKIMMKAQGLPVPLKLDIDLKDGAEAGTTEGLCTVDIDIPFMLKPMVAPHMKKAVGMLSEIIAKSVS